MKAFFKDLRLWSEFRTVQDLKEYRFRQVPTSPGLVVNFKLLNGNEKIYNEADLEAVQLPIAEAKGYTFQDDLGDLIICASDRYWVSGKCTAFPFQNNILLSYFTINTELHGH